MKIRVRIDSKTARKVFNGDFDSLPLQIISDGTEKYITKKEMKENYNRSKYIKKGDFKGLLKMEIRTEKIKPFIGNKNLYSVFIMEKLDNKWYIQLSNSLNNYMQGGTCFTFCDETENDIIDRELEERY